MHVPDAIGNHIYKMFASPTAKQDENLLKPKMRWDLGGQAGSLADHVMTFEDFCALYIVFK